MLKKRIENQKHFLEHHQLSFAEYADIQGKFGDEYEKIYPFKPYAFGSLTANCILPP